MTNLPERKGLIARLEPRWLAEADSTETENQTPIELLIDALQDDRPAVRGQAAVALIASGAAAVPALLAALRSADQSVWSMAAAALVKIGAPAVPHLLEALQMKRESESVQILLVEILGQIGDPRALDLLIQNLESESTPLQTVAAVALVRLGEAAVEPLLKAATDSRSALIRHHAISIVEQIGTPKAASALAAWRAIDEALS